MASKVVDWKPHLGRKVSLRYKLHDDTEHPFSEAIGVVASIGTDDDGKQTLAVLTRSGGTRSVPVDDIVASKLFPL